MIGFMEKLGNFYIEEAESDFKRVHKSIILNKDIDCLTLGIYVKILVLGKKWQLNIKGLSSCFDISDMKIRKSIALLEKEGYISRKAVQDEKTGKLAGWNYTLHAIPLEESKRTCAGRKNNEETVYPENRQHGYPTTRLSDNTETWEDNNNKPKEDIDLKEISKPNQYKEEIDKSISKKDCIDFGPIFSAWNDVANEVDDISSIKLITDNRKKQIRTLLKSCNSTCEELVRFIKTLPYADDWVIGKGDRKWSIDFDWLIQNTSNWYVAGLEGNMHKKNRYEFDKIMRGEEVFKQSKKLDGFQYL